MKMNKKAALQQQEIIKKLSDIITGFYTTHGRDNFIEYLPPKDLSQKIDLISVEKNYDWDVVFAWVEKYLKYSVKTDHPGFVNRMWAGANQPAIVGEIVTAITNTSACTYESAPVSTLMEKYMLDQMLDLAGFSNGVGQMTTGSSNANMIAMMAARNISCKSIKRAGLFDSNELYAFVNADAHYSMDKAANILGIGTKHLIKVPQKSNGGMNTEALQEQLTSITASGGLPFFVGATAGTTVRGAYDSIPDLLELKKRHNFWLHVDGAWGGAVIVNDRLRDKFLRGIEEVDSFTMDFHKMFGIALICNVLLMNRRKNIFRDLCSVGDTSYIFRQSEKEDDFNLGAQSLQCGRRVDSLKWFLDWKFYGKTGFAERIENYYALCEYAEHYVETAPELEMVVPRESFNICFRYKAPESIVNEFNLALRTSLYQSGISLVGYAYINNNATLRLLICNSQFTKSDVADFFNCLISTGNKLMKEWI